MALSPLTPVVIGVGDVVNRSLKLEDALEPALLMRDAIRNALADTNAQRLDVLQSRIDSIDVVACWTWPYDDLPGLLADQMNIKPIHTHLPAYHGGNQPAKLFDDAARRISRGECDIAVVCGGEALASLSACAKAGQIPPPAWTKISTDVRSVFSPTTRELHRGLGAAHHIGAPIQVYPLFENGLRAHRNQSLHENHDESAELYAEFAKVAEQNQFAWNYGRGAESAKTIGTVSHKNRMICFPYPLLMNAFNNVNLAAACILTSRKVAEELGVPRERWVYPLGGAGTRDSYDFWERPNYYSSPAISNSIDSALHVSGLTREDIDTYDFYSCFPIVPKIACRHLGLPTTNGAKRTTLLGGLTSFGGAGNNYSMHALTEMTRQIRQNKIQTGLVLANGGVMTYQYVVCLSKNPRKDKTPYPSRNPLPEVVETVKVPAVCSEAEGEAVIETYTIDYNRKGQPTLGHIVARLASNGQRFIANHGDAYTLNQLSSWVVDPIGRTGMTKIDSQAKARNLFYLSAAEKL